MDARIKNLVEDIRQAARLLDREEVSALCRQLIAEAHRHRLPDGSGVDVLKVLQRKRYFSLLQEVAEALIQTDQATLGVRRRWVQSLIDQNKLDEALLAAERLIHDTAGDKDEHPEARGLKGRALKQRYIVSCEQGARRDEEALRHAVRTYADAYYEDPGKRAWHGINTVALLARARRDSVHVPERETPRQVAEALLKQVDAEGAAMDAWAMASGLEACVALGDREGAIRWANGYAAHPGADAFELASTLRQMEEVWQLDPAEPMGAVVLPILRSGLLRREDGSIQVTAGEVLNAPTQEAVLGRESFVSLTWYRQGLDRARAVARISRTAGGHAAGTGFLVRGRNLAPGLPDEWLLLTNYHVVNEDERDANAVRPVRARISFSALTDDGGTRGYAVEPRPVWSSRDLDATLLRLAEVPPGVETLQHFAVADALPEPGEHTRVYVIGHPGGDVLSLSIHDNQLLAHRDPLLHYRTPTDQGSSGSPVFNDQWELIGLHHAGGSRGPVQRLDGPGTYAANEGIWIQSIRAAIGGTPPPRRAQRAHARLQSSSTPSSSRKDRTMDGKERVRAKVRDIEERDPELASELESRRDEAREEARSVAEGMMREGLAATESGAFDLAQETIVLRTGRPVLRIANDLAVLEFTDRDSGVWRGRLQRAQQGLARGIRAVGRVEVQGHRLDWLGTGALVAPDVIATNRHVAEEFGRADGTRFVFRQAEIGGGRMSADVDFLEEIDNRASLAFRVVEILHIEGPNGPDLALLRVDPTDGRQLPLCVPLSTRTLSRNQQVAIIGYPARDSRIPDRQLMDDIYGNVYDKKRLAPGQVTGVEHNAVLHDCTTLGGNSGSPLFDLETGEVVALHFAGRFLEANFAVPARLVADRLRVIGRSPCTGSPTGSRRNERGNGGGPDTVGTPGRDITVTVDAGGTTVTIPIQVTVTVGTPVSGGASPRPREDDEDPVREEGRPEDYADRPGYEPAFLGSGNTVSLPSVKGRRKDDVLTFQVNGRVQSELRYQHFSVVMSRSRRMCLFSAVNIDGGKSVKRKRVGWRLDPRIPREAQIRGECYGPEPKFSRGHMTRREDPVWGDGADRGNEDSMHVTNAVPQMQPFNAGIWLELEDYALDNARGDEMRISVFTGPILRDDDPVEYGVRIPRSFWKVIAFIHDKTGQLSATGYWMSQEPALADREFVFGEHGTSQRAISWIEEQTELSFGPLAAADPLRDVRESRPTTLGRLEEIRFI